jgi:predicted DsbA family dithiol-disulfide isomerase
MSRARLSTLLFFTLFIASAAGCVEAPKAKEPPPGPTVRVDVWHDTVCPWCRIGLHNLDTAIAGFQGARVEVVHHAYLLEPDAPPEGSDLRAHLAQKFGPNRVDAMLSRVSQAGAPYGIKFDWNAVAFSPSTAASHALIAWAPAEKRAAVVAAIHRAHFEEGKNLGDVNVLAAIARAAGLDEAAARAAITDPTRLAAVRAEAGNAAQRGISGVPHFEIGGRVLQGAQSPETIREALAGAVKG